MPSRSVIKVYSGLSLKEPDVKRILPGALFAGPIGRDDIRKDVARGIGTIVVVDGRFLQNLAVSPNEMMDAMRCGVRLYGCSSMGALRAAELAPYGMVGHGRIFEFVKATPDFRDDLLGQTFREEPLRALTVPHMDLHFFLRDHAARKRATTEQVEHVLHASASLHFAYRDIGTMREQLHLAHGTAAAPLCALAELAFREACQKRLDALATLALVVADLREIRSANERLARRPRRRAVLRNLQRR